MGVKKIYVMIVTEQDGTQHTLSLTTDNIVLSMEQYQRNRSYFTWEIIDVR